LPAHALLYEFDASNEGWTYLIAQNDGSSGGVLQAATAASWRDEANYDGADPAIGRPPVIGPLDPSGNGEGSINGQYDGTDVTDHLWLITSFASPVFAAEEMDSISAFFNVAGLETGIGPDVDVNARAWYKKEGSSSTFLGSFVDLIVDETLAGGYTALWTEASVGVAAGDRVTQVGIDVWVSGDPGGATNTGNLNFAYIDRVSSAGDGGNGNGVPLPMPFLLMVSGLLGLVGARRLG